MEEKPETDPKVTAFIESRRLRGFTEREIYEEAGTVASSSASPNQITIARAVIAEFVALFRDDGGIPELKLRIVRED